MLFCTLNYFNIFGFYSSWPVVDSNILLRFTNQWVSHIILYYVLYYVLCNTVLQYLHAGTHWRFCKTSESILAIKQSWNLKWLHLSWGQN